MIPGPRYAAFALVGHEMPPPEAVCWRSIGLSPEQAMQRPAPHLPDAETRALAEAYRVAFVELRAAGRAEARARSIPARGTRSTTAAAPDLLLGIATGKARRGLDRVSRSTIQALFRHRPDRRPASLKPHPGILARHPGEDRLRPATQS